MEGYRTIIIIIIGQEELGRHDEQQLPKLIIPRFGLMKVVLIKRLTILHTTPSSNVTILQCYYLALISRIKMDCAFIV